MTVNNGDTLGMGRDKNVAPATAQAAASEQYTAKSTSHARDRSISNKSATPMKINQSYTELDKTEATNAS
jgi:hypothetical protein